ncbi:hypothetical protein [Mycolicibacterium gilvum]|uniref:HTH cro/C1-type domain-containing protein n=1 Tax=Mycolicibacterium gilvum (strain DSM 45189 / LMG 24558 / Spyr1) TaxID=278137 RepID=E6TH08_MYCSR|nr:hypothetical protein [Mycolicibacterium gilvum]ADT97888.1 hypothetical protein Mspyr1_12070 [Mycolicibacterium gilvum Spyr1]
MATDWAAEQAARIGGELRRLRGRRSAQWVSDRTAELGHRVPRSTVSEIENGRRTYATTVELMVLARALDTAPVLLLFPPPLADSVEMLPGDKRSKWAAAEWFSGRISEQAAFFMSGDDDELARNLQPLRAADRIAELEQRRNRLMVVIGLVDDRTTRQVLVDDLAELHAEITRLAEHDGG